MMKLVLQTNFINYHTQENVYSGYMNIFSGDSSLWFPQGIATACGLFTTGSNIYATLNRLDYAVHVSSRTIIGYILPLVVQMLLVLPSWVIGLLQVMLLKLAMDLVLVCFLTSPITVDLVLELVLRINYLLIIMITTIIRTS